VRPLIRLDYILMPTTSFKHVGLSVCLYFLISAIYQYYRRCVPRRSPRLRSLQRRNSRYTAKKIPNPPRALSLRHPRRCGACRVFHNLHATALSVCFSLSLSYRIQTLGLGPNLENSFSSLVMLLSNKIDTQISVFHASSCYFDVAFWFGTSSEELEFFSGILTLESGSRIRIQTFFEML
jgi:hypothetical protein